MKKNISVLIALLSTLALSSCGIFQPSSSFNSGSSSQNESSISSDSESSSASEESSSSSLESSESSTSTSSSIISSNSSSSGSSSSEVSSSSSTSSSVISSSSSSSSSVSSSSSSSEPSSSSENSSTSAPDPDPELVAQHASYTYQDLFKNSVYTLSTTPCLGKANILVIPVWFTDSSNYILEDNKDNVREDIQTSYFGSNDETGWRSVKTYYEEESHGALSIDGTVSDWYACGKASTYYGNDANTSRTTLLVKEASNWYFTQNPSASRLDYDEDGDGYLDGVMLIYGGPDLQAANKTEDPNYENLWAYCYWTQDATAKNVANPGANAFFWASYDFMYGKTKATLRTGKSGGPYNGDTSHCNLDTHTFIHEMGHMFGLNDYYDYSGQYNPAGGFSMQDANVGGHDPFSSFALGWGKAYVPTKTVTINLRPFAETGEMILLSPNFNEYNSPFDEYLLIEFYTPTGLNAFDTQYQYGSRFPQGPSQMGIRLWHVDDRLYYQSGYGYSSTYKFTTNPSDKSHKVDEAFTNTYDDGTEETEGYLSPLGSDYYDFNQLQLIRNSTKTSHKVKSDFSSSSLFKAGSSFNMNTYKKQFVNSDKLNQEIDLGFSFSVNTVNEEYANITITKL